MSPPLRALALLSFVASVSARPCQADEPTLAEVQRDPAATPPAGARSRLFFTGLALTAGWYGVALGTSYLWSDAPNAERLRLPVVGPYIALGNVGCGNDEENCTTFTVVIRTTFAVLSAVGQTGGVLGMVESFFLPSQTPASALGEPASHSAGFATHPVVTGDLTGWAFAGQF